MSILFFYIYIMNVFLQDLEYITLEGYKESSKSELIDSDDNDIIMFIVKAESKIREKVEFDGDVPIAIQQATVLLTDRLYEDSLIDFNKKELIEEKDENHTRKYQVMYRADSMKWDIWDLLRPYLKSRGKFYRT